MTVSAHHNQGFTLVELVVGIVVFSIALSIITQWIAPLTRQSVEPIWQVRATELAQSLMNEISAKSFDENSDRATGQVRCNEDLDDSGVVPDSPGEILCTAEAGFGPDGILSDPIDPLETRDVFDDVDDYDGFREQDGNIRNSLNAALVVDGQNLYQGFVAEVDVSYDEGYLENPDGNQLRKRITVTITTPGNQALQFTRYRSNF